MVSKYDLTRDRTRVNRPKERLSDEVLVKQIPAQVKGLILENVGTDLDTSQFLAHIISRWGGPEELASDLYNEFRAAGQGGIVRKHILELVQRLVIQATNSQTMKVKRPADMTDEELDSLILGYMERLNRGERGTAVEAIERIEEGDQAEDPVEIQ